MTKNFSPSDEPVNLFAAEKKGISPMLGNPAARSKVTIEDSGLDASSSAAI
jgi:hypothetical protein